MEGMHARSTSWSRLTSLLGNMHEFTGSVTEESCEGDHDLVEQVYEYIAAGTYSTGGEFFKF